MRLYRPCWMGLARARANVELTALRWQLYVAPSALRPFPIAHMGLRPMLVYRRAFSA
jgi:hypothetical protein